jgi:uncharacterized delta-60 repeat protein
MFSHFAGLARYQPDGTLDTSFGNAGTIEMSFGNDQVFHTDAVVLSDGKLMVLASLSDGITFAELIRYNPDGSLDAGFGTAGELRIPFGDHLLLQPDGHLLVSSSQAVARYNSDGSLDATFGMGGIVITTLPAAPGAVALQADEKIVLAGATQSGQLAVFRFTSTGAFDTTFASSGLALFTNLAPASSMAVDAAGRILMCGDRFGQTQFLVRLEPDGSQDLSFGPVNGTGTPITSPNVVFVQADGDILLAGTMGNRNFSRGTVARLFSDPAASQRLPFFLDALYRDALGRAVDATGESNFQQAFDSGALTTAQIAGEVFGSEEYFSDLALTFYRRFLHRDIDPTGLSDVVSALEHGVTDEVIIAGIVGSPEYAAVRT